MPYRKGRKSYESGHGEHISPHRYRPVDGRPRVQTFKLPFLSPSHPTAPFLSRAFSLSRSVTSPGPEEFLSPKFGRSASGILNARGSHGPRSGRRLASYTIPYDNRFEYREKPREGGRGTWCRGGRSVSPWNSAIYSGQSDANSRAIVASACGIRNLTVPSVFSEGSGESSCIGDDSGPASYNLSLSRREASPGEEEEWNGLQRRDPVTVAPLCVQESPVTPRSASTL